MTKGLRGRNGSHRSREGVFQLHTWWRRVGHRWVLIMDLGREGSSRSCFIIINCFSWVVYEETPTLNRV